MVKIDYSIVIPVFFNEGCLVPLMQSLDEQVLRMNPGYVCEAVFVDDGSGDGSLEELLYLHRIYPKIVRVIKLTRNFGQPAALLAGFEHARGKCVIAISADGQDPVNLINDMLKSFFQDGYEVVLCTRSGRDESLFRRMTSRIFYKLMKKLSFPDMPLEGFDYFLMSERTLSIFLKNIDANPFFQGQIFWMGFKTKFINYKRGKRLTGKSRWTFAKKMTYLIDGVLAYSFTPIRLSSIAGIILALLGFLYALIVFFSKIFLGNPVKGWAPIVIIILLIGGFQLLMQGITGEYLWRTLSQVRNRDKYIIDKIYEGDED
jgi:dolichol-phosphate mannosyltransferase